MDGNISYLWNKWPVLKRRDGRPGLRAGYGSGNKKKGDDNNR